MAREAIPGLGKAGQIAGQATSGRASDKQARPSGRRNIIDIMAL
jgi:hypothetical protein